MSHFEAVVIAGHHWNPCVNKPNSVVLISLEGSSWNSDDTYCTPGEGLDSEHRCALRDEKFQRGIRLGR